MEVYLTLPFPPTVNSYYVKTRQGIFISAKGRKFRNAVLNEAVQQKAYELKMEERISMEVILYPPDERRRDVDNYMKGLLDSITNAGVWIDDQQVDMLTIHRGVKTSPGVCRIRLTEHHGLIMPNKDEIWDYLES